MSDEDWETLENALTLAPSSYGLQPFKFIVITDQETKEKITPAAYGQTQPADCSHLVVVTYKKILTDEYVERFVERIVEVRGVERESLAEYETDNEGFSEESRRTTIHRNMEFASGISRARIFARDSGDDWRRCVSDGRLQRRKKSIKILGLEEYSAVTLCAIGYRDAENDWLAGLPKVRFSEREVN